MTPNFDRCKRCRKFHARGFECGGEESKSAFVRASHAVEDALASDDNHPDDIARAVLMAVREPGHDGSVWGEHNATNFTAMIDAILNEKE